MNALRLGLLLQLAALALVAALPAGAGAENVPPGNSGANQYTEVYPTGGGNRNAYAEGDELSPDKVIGKKNVTKLKEHGEEGEEVAELAAETAPVAEDDGEVVVVEEEGSSGGGTGGGAGNASGGGNGGGDGAASGEPANQQPRIDSPTTTPVAADTDVQGSGGFGEIVSQMFGTSGNGMGALLPLLTLGAIAWAFLFAARQRQHPAD